MLAPETSMAAFCERGSEDRVLAFVAATAFMTVPRSDLTAFETGTAVNTASGRRCQGPELHRPPDGLRGPDGDDWLVGQEMIGC